MFNFILTILSWLFVIVLGLGLISLTVWMFRYGFSKNEDL